MSLSHARSPHVLAVILFIFVLLTCCPLNFAQVCDDGEMKIVMGCQGCPRGSYQDETGHELTTCKLCPKGYYTDVVSTATCKDCVVGKYNNQEENDQESDCLVCAKGRYNEQVHQKGRKKVGQDRLVFFLGIQYSIRPLFTFLFWGCLRGKEIQYLLFKY
jgi:hypothetical protein